MNIALFRKLFISLQAKHANQCRMRYSGVKIAFGLYLLFAIVPFVSKADAQNYVKTETYLDVNETHATTVYDYYDGLGRKSLTASNAMNTDGKYIYTLQTYDSNGRLSEQWLPVVGTTSPSYLDRSEIASLASSTYNDTYAYSNKHYNVFDEPMAIDEAGFLWHVADKKVVTNYSTNAYGEVKRYNIDSSDNGLIWNGNTYYSSGTLTKEHVIDADSIVTIIYKDMLGRIVLERRNDGSQNLDTYYVYNAHGQLAYVLSPGYQESGQKNIHGYEYRYDNYGRCIKKILPQCDYTQYWYDDEGRLIGEQTPMMREKGKTRFFLYDAMSRLVVQGICDNLNYNHSCEVTWSTNENTLFGSGYQVSFNGLLSHPRMEVVNYYDNYTFLTVPFFSTQGVASILQKSDPVNACGLPTGSITGTTVAGEYIFKAVYYDIKQNPIEERVAENDGFSSVATTTYSFTGKPLMTAKFFSKGSDSFIVRKFSGYDVNTDMQRSMSMMVNSGASTPLKTFDYDDLGRLDTETLSHNAGSITYNYNVRSWISDINGTGFHEWLQYNTGLGTPRYGGDISCQIWQVDGESFIRGYKFSYDKAGRFLQGAYGEGSDLSSHTDRYTEKIGEFKQNGHFRRLQRYGLKANGIYGKIDNLHLYYDYNRLKAVKEDALPVNTNGSFDFSGSSTTTSEDVQYGYYDDGSLKWDANKGIAYIDYTASGMPLRIQFTNGHVTEYVYSGDGRRLRTLYRTAVPNVSVAIGSTLALNTYNTLSVDTVEFFGDIIYGNGQLDKILFDGGYCTFAGNLSQPTYHYFTRDHLGNVRAVVNQDGTIEQVNHYYPFGGIFADAGQNDALQKYKYNGKELDRMHGLNFYDYGARQYDPILGMFTQMDPLCEKYYNFHPYAYCGNNPINCVDPDGKDWYQDTDKTYQYSPEVHSQKDLKEGQTYLWKSKNDKKAGINYRKDGSILYNNETDAYNRMWDQADQHYRTKKSKGGREVGAFILSDGKVLVLPDYANDATTSHISEYGYKVNTDGTLSHGNEIFNVLGNIHTHQERTTDPKPSASIHGGDDLAISRSMGDMPVITIGHDNKVYGIYHKRGGKPGQYSDFDLRSRIGLLKGRYKIYPWLKKQKF